MNTRILVGVLGSVLCLFPLVMVLASCFIEFWWCLDFLGFRASHDSHCNFGLFLIYQWIWNKECQAVACEGFICGCSRLLKDGSIAWWLFGLKSIIISFYHFWSDSFGIKLHYMLSHLQCFPSTLHLKQFCNHWPFISQN